MSTIVGSDSSALLERWRELSRKPSATQAAVADTQQVRISIRVDRQTSEWVLDVEFPKGGPKPKIIDSLKFIRVEEGLTAAIPKRRVISVHYEPNGNDCIELWPHFAEALVAAAVGQKQKTHCAQSIARTFETWRKFWPGKRKLGPDQILGLFGELSCLRQLIADLSASAAVEAWHGPEARDHDFGLKKVALEVKTSAGRTRKVTIANLDQLDGSGLDGLNLIHARLRASSDPKLSLQALAESIQAKLSKELLVKFAAKLGRAGWFKATQQQRDGARFRFVERKVYRVVDGFPRILRPDLRQFGPGVDVKKYTLDLNACSKFVLEPADEKELWQRLRTDDNR